MKKATKFIINEFILPMIVLTVTFAPFTGCMLYLLLN